MSEQFQSSSGQAGVGLLPGKTYTFDTMLVSLSRLTKTQLLVEQRLASEACVMLGVCPRRFSREEKALGEIIISLVFLIIQ
ncbi:hypothetical protein E2C01_010541 [Portunus trituberculatus]|uniref:Uncharacterized protein n=1 Tax=Portunus trituberculatus TaxID=210409 RepID=A0A5B7D8X5_PORTR|nr:hypothetical protein [Portunus trituberculatus]